MILAAAGGEDEAVLSLKNESKDRLYYGAIAINALQTELKLLKNLPMASSIEKSISSLSDLSKLLTPAMAHICRSESNILRLYMAIPMSNATTERSLLIPQTRRELCDKQSKPRTLEPQNVLAHPQKLHWSSRFLLSMPWLILSMITALDFDKQYYHVGRKYFQLVFIARVYVRCSAASIF